MIRPTEKLMWAAMLLCSSPERCIHLLLPGHFACKSTKGNQEFFQVNQNIKEIAKEWFQSYVFVNCTFLDCIK